MLPLVRLAKRSRFTHCIVKRLDLSGGSGSIDT